MSEMAPAHEESDPVLALLEQALETYRDEYKDIWETWKSLDTKAQGIGAISGVFLAAVFAWIRELPTSFGPVEIGLLAVGVILLVVATAFAVAALQIRTVTAPPFGDQTWEMIKDLLEPTNQSDLKTRLPAFIRDQVNLWRDSNKELLEQNLMKAARIARAQWSVLAAALCVALLSLTAIL